MVTLASTEPSVTVLMRTVSGARRDHTRDAVGLGDDLAAFRGRSALDLGGSRAPRSVSLLRVAARQGRPDPAVKVLWRAGTRNRWRLLAGCALIALHQGCEATVPIVIGATVDHAVSTGSLARLAFWVGLLGLLFLLLTTAYRNGARQLMRALAEESHALRLEVAAKVLTPGADVRTGDVLTISTTDADHASYLLDYVPRIIGALVATAVSAVGLCMISVPLGLVVLVGTPVVLLAMQWAAPLITRRVAERQELAGRASSVATDLVTG